MKFICTRGKKDMRMLCEDSLAKTCLNRLRNIAKWMESKLWQYISQCCWPCTDRSSLPKIMLPFSSKKILLFSWENMPAIRSSIHWLCCKRSQTTGCWMILKALEVFISSWKVLLLIPFTKKDQLILQNIFQRWTFWTWSIIWCKPKELTSASPSKRNAVFVAPTLLIRYFFRIM